MVRRGLLLVTVLVAALSNGAAGQRTDSSDLINEALDHPVGLELNTALPQALEAIAQHTGVRIEADRSVWELLPWGDQTQVSARIDNQPLRTAVDQMARKLGLVAVVRSNVVELQPVPALRRLGRRAVQQEITALDLLASTPFNIPAEQHTVRSVVDGVDDRLAELKSEFAVEFRPAESIRPSTAVNVARNATLADALESISRDTAATWYPWGKSILVVPKTDQVRAQLEKPITARYNNVTVGQVLLEISQSSGIDFSYEPGALQRVPPSASSINLLLDNATVRDALEQISAYTGLGYVVTERGVYIWNQLSVGNGSRDPIIGAIPLQGGFEAYIQQSQLPLDVQEYLQHKAREGVARIREQMKNEGYTPASPASQPATNP